MPLTTCGDLLVNNNFCDENSRRQLFGLRVPDDSVEVGAAQDKQL